MPCCAAPSAKCETWPWPSGIVAGMPSAYRRSPRTPKLARAPKPRIDTCRSCAWFWRSRTTTPGTRGSASARDSAGRARRSVVASSTSSEAGTSVSGRASRVALTTTGSSRTGGVVSAANAASGASSRQGIIFTGAVCHRPP